jgi:response regulator of citrate/malate metabolism
MSKNLNILIVEDELLIAEMLKEMLLELEYTVSGVARDFDAAQKILKNDININFAILDINLNQSKNGIDVAKTLNIPFVFLTSYFEKTIIQEAIEYKPQAYLIKPFTKTDLYTTLEIIKQKISMDAQLNSVVIKDGHSNIKILITGVSPLI